MHAPITTEQALQPSPASTHPGPVHYHGNRVAICQECYERADGKQAQSKTVEETQAKLTKFSWPTMDSSPTPDLELRPQQFDRDVMEAGADAGCVGQTNDSQIPHIYAAQEFMWVYHQYCNCPRCRSITSQAFNAQKQDDARRLAGQAKQTVSPAAIIGFDDPSKFSILGTCTQKLEQCVQTEEGQRKLAEQAKPLTSQTSRSRAKLEMPTETEVRALIYDIAQEGSLRIALGKFVERRNAKL
jgi:hypothetical protein